MELVDVMDKAGSYAFQEHGEMIISSVRGGYGQRHRTACQGCDEMPERPGIPGLTCPGIRTLSPEEKAFPAPKRPSSARQSPRLQEQGITCLPGTIPVYCKGHRKHSFQQGPFLYIFRRENLAFTMHGGHQVAAGIGNQEPGAPDTAFQHFHAGIQQVSSPFPSFTDMGTTLPLK